MLATCWLLFYFQAGYNNILSTAYSCLVSTTEKQPINMDDHATGVDNGRNFLPIPIHVTMKFHILIVIAVLSLALPMAASAQKPAAGNKDTVVVVAEGIGLTAEAAEKQAFRTAVRQGVGTLIDASTLIKNDKLIEDEVLTYSNGFIKSWEVLSTRRKDSVFIVTIKAVVKRRDLAERLTKFKITSSKVDGKNLFGAAVTRMEARENATLMLAKVFEEWPRLLTAIVDEDQAYDDVEKELLLHIKLGITPEDYIKFQKRLLGVVSEIAIAKQTVLTRTVRGSSEAPIFNKGQPHPVYLYGNERNVDRDTADRLVEETPNKGLFLDMNPVAGAELQSRQADTWCLWIMPGRVTSSGARWQGFLLDTDLSVIIPYLTGNYHSLEIVVRNAAGEVLSESPSPIEPGLYPTGEVPLYNSLLATNVRVKNPYGFPYFYGSDLGGVNSVTRGTVTRGTVSELKSFWGKTKKSTRSQINVFFSAYSMRAEGWPPVQGGRLHVFPYLHVEQKFPLSVDLLKQVDSIEARVKFALPRTDSP